MPAFVANTCLGTFTWGEGGNATGRVTAESLTSIPRQDGFLFARVYALSVLPGRSLCGLVFTHLPALPVQLKASGCLPNTDRRPLKQPAVTGQPSGCHGPQRSPILNTHLCPEFRETAWTASCEWDHRFQVGSSRRKEREIHREEIDVDALFFSG